MICLIVAGFLTACGSKSENNPQEMNNDAISQEIDSLDDLREKTPLTLEDLDRIDEYRFPVSYTYNVYNLEESDTAIETGEYIYPKWVNHRLLLPIHENMASREIISSVMKNDKIETLVDIVLDNGEIYPVRYIINPDTLQYIRASVNTPTTTTTYTFQY